jgi:ABC-type multidrug transport system fused ATPase/permease subunit
LALALLRIVEPSAGRILVDNANIAHVKLDTIRARLTVVPQDPVLFSGSIRFNLDPCDIFSESALWEVLQLVHMKGFVDSLPDQLNHQVSEGGSNLVSF